MKAQGNPKRENRMRPYHRYSRGAGGVIPERRMQGAGVMPTGCHGFIGDGLSGLSLCPGCSQDPGCHGSRGNPVPGYLITGHPVGDGERSYIPSRPGGSLGTRRVILPSSSSRGVREHNLFSRFHQPYTYDGGRTRSAG